jgi:hypothetical protein
VLHDLPRRGAPTSHTIESALLPPRGRQCFSAECSDVLRRGDRTRRGVRLGEGRELTAF